MKMSTIKMNAKKDTEYVANLGKPGVPYNLDLSDDRQYRYVLNCMRLGGHSRSKSPQLYKAVEQSRKAHRENGPHQEQTLHQILEEGAPVPENAVAINDIPHLGTEPTGGVAATGLSSIPGGTVMTSMGMTIYDPNMNPVGSNNPAPIYGHGEYQTMGVISQAGMTFSQGENLKSVLFVMYQRSGQPLMHQKITRPLGYNSLECHPEVTAPESSNSPDYIKVGLNRTPDIQKHCDYIYQSPIDPTTTHPFLKLPMIGSVRFDSPPDKTSIKGPVFYVVKATGGSEAATAKDMTHFNNAFTVNDNTLSWNFHTEEFNPAKWASGEMTHLNFGFMINTVNVPDGVFVGVSSVTNPETETPASGTTYILPIMFVWGCLAKDTLVTMEDGTTREIQDIQVGERVRSGKTGPALTVCDTTIGTEFKPMIQIRDNNGNRILLTDGHPVLTPTGVKLARELNKGDSVLTENGGAILVDVTTTNYDDYVYNLVLYTDDSGEGVEGSSDEDKMTFLANGFQVGDNNMQKIYGERFRSQPKNILESLPKEWHWDYKNWHPEARTGFDSILIFFKRLLGGIASIFKSTAT